MLTPLRASVDRQGRSNYEGRRTPWLIRCMRWSREEYRSVDMNVVNTQTLGSTSLEYAVDQED